MAFLAGTSLVAYDASPGAEYRWFINSVCADNTPEDVTAEISLSLAQSGGASTPTAEALLQWSPDGNIWFTLARLNTDGTTSTDAETVTVQLCPRLRVKLDVGGGTPPDVELDVAMRASAGVTVTVTPAAGG